MMYGYHAWNICMIPPLWIHYCGGETNELGLPTCCHTPKFKFTVHDKRTAWRPSSRGSTISLASCKDNLLPPLLVSLWRLATKHMEHQGVQTPKLCHSLLLALRGTTDGDRGWCTVVFHPNDLEFAGISSTKGELSLPACSPKLSLLYAFQIGQLGMTIGHV